MKFKTLEEKKLLADRVLNAYKQLTGLNLYPTKNEDYEGYILLIEQIQVTLGLENKVGMPGVYALMVFFCDNKKLGITPANRILFEKFIKQAELKSQEGFTKNDTKSDRHIIVEQNIFSGADVIDHAFKNTILSGYQYEPEHFYLFKNNYDCQWFGTFHRWDAKPYRYDETKQEIKDSLQTNDVVCNISAVLQGKSGNGKSTFLRRLAYDFIDNGFVTLWITDLSLFNLNIGNIKRSYSQLYLLVLEDWEELTGNSKKGQSFLFAVTKLKNVRILIAGNGKDDQPYFTYFQRSKALFLSQWTMIPAVLDRVVDVIPDWQELTRFGFPELNFYYKSVSIALFAIYTASRKPKSNLRGADTEFLNTIRDDLQLIDEIYPGLTKALVYWGYIEEEFHSTVLITWNVLFKLADFFNENQKPRKPPEPFDDKIYGILMYYISLEPVVYPLYRNEHLVQFNHYLISQEGFTNVFFNGEINYDKNTIIEIVNLLSASNFRTIEYGIAGMLADAYCTKYEEDIKFNFSSDTDLDRFLRGYYAKEIHRNCRVTNKLVRDVYKAASIRDKPSHFWHNMLNYLSIEYFCFRIDRKDLVFILKTIITKGCRDTNVIRAYKISSKGSLPFIYCMSKVFHENAIGIDKNSYYDIMAFKPWGRKFKVGRWIAKREKFFKKFFISGNPTTENENTNLKN